MEETQAPQGVANPEATQPAATTPEAVTPAPEATAQPSAVSETPAAPVTPPVETAAQTVETPPTTQEPLATIPGQEPAPAPVAPDMTGQTAPSADLGPVPGSNPQEATATITNASGMATPQTLDAVDKAVEANSAPRENLLTWASNKIGGLLGKKAA